MMKWKLTHTKDRQIAIKVDMIESIPLTIEEMWNRLQETLKDYHIELLEDVTNHALLGYSLAVCDTYKVVALEDIEGNKQVFYLSWED